MVNTGAYNVLFEAMKEMYRYLSAQHYGLREKNLTTTLTEKRFQQLLLKMNILNMMEDIEDEVTTEEITSSLKSIDTPISRSPSFENPTTSYTATSVEPKTKKRRSNSLEKTSSLLQNIAASSNKVIEIIDDDDRELSNSKVILDQNQQTIISSSTSKLHPNRSPIVQTCHSPKKGTAKPASFEQKRKISMAERSRAKAANLLSNLSHLTADKSASLLPVPTVNSTMIPGRSGHNKNNSTSPTNVLPTIRSEMWNVPISKDYNHVNNDFGSAATTTTTVTIENMEPCELAASSPNKTKTDQTKGKTKQTRKKGAKRLRMKALDLKTNYKNPLEKCRIPGCNISYRKNFTQHCKTHHANLSKAELAQYRYKKLPPTNTCPVPTCKLKYENNLENHIVSHHPNLSPEYVRFLKTSPKESLQNVVTCSVCKEAIAHKLLLRHLILHHKFNMTLDENKLIYQQSVQGISI